MSRMNRASLSSIDVKNTPLCIYLYIKGRPDFLLLILSLPLPGSSFIQFCSSWLHMNLDHFFFDVSRFWSDGLLGRHGGHLKNSFLTQRVWVRQVPAIENPYSRNECNTRVYEWRFYYFLSLSIEPESGFYFHSSKAVICNWQEKR